MLRAEHGRQGQGANKYAGGGKHGVFKVAPSEVNPEDVDTLLAHEMNEMSKQEREQAYDRIHGIRPVPSDEEQRVQAALLQMQTEIDCIHEKPAYNEALRMGSAYIFDQKFRKRFLWAEDLDPTKAAMRMIKFLQYSSEVYGPEVLMRPIRYSDLTPGAVSYFKSGSGLMLPARDTSGRRVLCIAKDCIATLDRVRLARVRARPYHFPEIFMFSYFSLSCCSHSLEWNTTFGKKSSTMRRNKSVELFSYCACSM